MHHFLTFTIDACYQSTCIQVFMLDYSTQFHVNIECSFTRKISRVHIFIISSKGTLSSAFLPVVILVILILSVPLTPLASYKFACLTHVRAKHHVATSKHIEIYHEEKIVTTNSLKDQHN